MIYRRGKNVLLCDMLEARATSDNVVCKEEKKNKNMQMYLARVGGRGEGGWRAGGGGGGGVMG